jgi:ComF family protein
VTGRRTILRHLHTVAAGLGDLVLPQTCLACGSSVPAADGLCEDCNVELLSLVSLPSCPRCGTTLGPHIPAREDGCSACPDTLPRFERVVRLGPYAGPLRSIVRELKYRRRAMRRRLGEMLGRAVQTRTDDELDVAMPVPMHWRRRLARGGNHARTLASAVARELGLPVGRELVRVRNTPPQTHLPRSKRVENVRGAFAVEPPAAVKGARVLLVDDVTTTGATANEAARTLLRAGARHVILAVVCKAEPPTAYARRLV